MMAVSSLVRSFSAHNNVTKNCLSQVLEDSGTGSDSDVTCLFKIFLERSISYVITQIRNLVKLLNLALYQSF